MVKEARCESWCQKLSEEVIQHGTQDLNLSDFRYTSAILTSDPNPLNPNQDLPMHYHCIAITVAISYAHNITIHHGLQE